MTRMIPLAVPNIGPAERASVAKAMEDGWVSSVGPDVPAFEKAVGAVSGTEQAVAVASGTAAIMIALRALGIGRGDLVLCPTYTFIATANAITAAGADPVFVDADPVTWAVSLDSCAEAIDRIEKAGAQPPRAMVVVYPMGNPPDMEPYRAFARRHGLVIVADAAAAIGARFDGEPIGLLTDATTFSFNGNKTMTTGGGGAIVGPAAMLANARALANTGRVGSDYDHDRPAYNERMTNIEAALGLAQIARLPDFIAAKAAIRARHDACAARLGLATFPRNQRACDGDWFSGVVLPREAVIRDIVAAMNADGVGVRLFWKPMHQQPAYAELFAGLYRRIGLGGMTYPVADALWMRVLPLPCSTHLSDEEIERTHASLERALARTGSAAA